MPRNRIIRHKHWKDPELGDIGPYAQLLLLGMRNFADDNGILPFDPEFIKDKIFPNERDTHISHWVCELEVSKFILVYLVNGTGYIALADFHEQNPQRPTYKWPTPTEDLEDPVQAARYIFCEVQDRPAAPTPPITDKYFEAFWTHYPHAEGVTDAADAASVWETMVDSEESAVQACKTLAAQLNAEDHFVPEDAATWLTEYASRL